MLRRNFLRTAGMATTALIIPIKAIEIQEQEEYDAQFRRLLGKVYTSFNVYKENTKLLSDRLQQKVMTFLSESSDFHIMLFIGQINIKYFIHFIVWIERNEDLKKFLLQRIIYPHRLENTDTWQRYIAIKHGKKIHRFKKHSPTEK